jgi:hypothetical protein
MADKPDTLAAAMAKAFAAIEGATKSANNPHFKSKYADLTSVIEAIKPALVANGLFFTQSPRPNEKGVEIETTLHHAGGDTFSLGSLFVPADRNNAQAFGSALTYARRYALVTAFGVPVEDDDGNAAAQAPAAPKAKEPAISDDDFAKITMLAKATQSEVANICKAAKVASLNDLTPAQAAKVIGKLEDKLAAMAKAESDAKQPTLADEIGDDIPY